MAQIYFLSVLINLFGGGILASDYFATKVKGLAFLTDISARKNAKIIVGGLSVLIGLLHLIFKSPGETVPVAGDLIPSLSALAIGFFLLLGLPKSVDPSRMDAEDEEDSSEQTAVSNIGVKLQPYRIPLGISGVIISIIHFILPGVLLL